MIYVFIFNIHMLSYVCICFFWGGWQHFGWLRCVQVVILQGTVIDSPDLTPHEDRPCHHRIMRTGCSFQGRERGSPGMCSVRKDVT